MQGGSIPPLISKFFIMKYAIVSSWNGEGYSELNVLDCIREFSTPLERDSFLVSKFAVEGIKLNADNGDYSTLTDGCFSYQYNDSHGSWQALELKPDAHGIVIVINYNEAEVLTERNFSAVLNEALAQADPEDDKHFTNGRLFVSAYRGDYDYQFILL